MLFPHVAGLCRDIHVSMCLKVVQRGQEDLDTTDNNLWVVRGVDSEAENPLDRTLSAARNVVCGDKFKYEMLVPKDVIESMRARVEGVSLHQFGLRKLIHDKKIPWTTLVSTKWDDAESSSMPLLLHIVAQDTDVVAMLLRKLIKCVA